jgi:hypothetical protein
MGISFFWRWLFLGREGGFEGVGSACGVEGLRLPAARIFLGKFAQEWRIYIMGESEKKKHLRKFQNLIGKS